MVIYTSDNGPSLPSGRTNLYDPGMREPMFISSPIHTKRRNQVTYAMSSHLDIVPTMFDWFNIKANSTNDIDSNTVTSKQRPILTGKSLLPLLVNEPPEDPDAAVFASQSYHEITMNYPMRAIRTKRYKLIHNLNYRAPFPIDQDFYVSPTFQVTLLINFNLIDATKCSLMTFLGYSQSIHGKSTIALVQDVEKVLQSGRMGIVRSENGCR